MGELSPLKAVRKYCVETCMEGSEREVNLCSLENCPLWEYRFGKRPKGKKTRYTPIKAIRNRCMDCAESLADIRDCPGNGKEKFLCPLHPFRMGKNPQRIGVGDETRIGL